MRADRRLEPWPLALAAALVGMICVSLLFFWVARTHPDPEVARAGRRPTDGWVAPGPHGGTAHP